MVEGPGVHRVAVAHRRVLLAKAFSATSPSGVFKEGAKAIDGRYLSLIEVHGKNIFYFFTRKKIANAVLEKLPEDVVVVHIHFGMSGSFRTFELPGPDPREKTRLRLENKKDNVVAHLSASICVHGDLQLYRKRVADLGPDPLRDDADKEVVWSKMQKSKKTIGGIIMDQSFIAGIGNIYRTEILFVIGVHPNQRVSMLTRSTFEELWSQSVRLLRIGVATGNIITVSPDEAGKPYSKLKSGERRYIYSHETCRRCGGQVRSWTCAARTVYACKVCQPLEHAELDSAVGEDVQPDESKAKSLSLKSKTVSVKKTPGVKKAKAESSTVKLSKKRKVRDGKIVEHQALKDIPTGGLVDFPSNLDEMEWPNAEPEPSPEQRSHSQKVVSEGPTTVVVDDSRIELSQAGRRSTRVTRRIRRLGVDG